MHYVLWGISLNISMVFLAANNPDLSKSLFDTLNSA